MQDPYGIRVNISTMMSLKMICFISQRRYGYDLVLDIDSNFRKRKREFALYITQS